MLIVEMRNLEQMLLDSRVLIRHKTHDAVIACHHEFDFPFPSDCGGCMLAYNFLAHLRLHSCTTFQQVIMLLLPFSEISFSIELR